MKLKREKTMVGKYWAGVAQIKVVQKLDLNGNQVLQKPSNIGYLL